MEGGTRAGTAGGELGNVGAGGEGPALAGDDEGGGVVSESGVNLSHEALPGGETEGVHFVLGRGETDADVGGAHGAGEGGAEHLGQGGESEGGRRLGWEKV